jgi:hypothetical protein
VDQGYTGNGTSQYLNTGLNPSSAGGNIALNSSMIGCMAKGGSILSAMVVCKSAQLMGSPRQREGSAGSADFNFVEIAIGDL